MKLVRPRDLRFPRVLVLSAASGRQHLLHVEELR
jgi:hypothetical protein